MSRYFFDEAAAVRYTLSTSPDACTAAELAHLTGLSLTDASDIKGCPQSSIPAILAELQADGVVRLGESAWVLSEVAPSNPAAAELKLTGNRIRALVAIGNAPWPRTPHGLADTVGVTRSAMTAAVNWLVHHRPAWLHGETTWEPVPGAQRTGGPPWRDRAVLEIEFPNNRWSAPRPGRPDAARRAGTWNERGSREDRTE
ncbi:MarR family transcriptional regulator [Nocardia terpenica]|uniref:MarR family transcriptional regulator n=1 Tax=Nocardia terpenica TaxID=455432 RepID=UPI0018E0A25C